MSRGIFGGVKVSHLRIVEVASCSGAVLVSLLLMHSIKLMNNGGYRQILQVNNSMVETWTHLCALKGHLSQTH